MIVTHDLGGEYGHGAHKCVASTVCKSVSKLAARKNYNGGRSKTLYPWQVKKLYIHLYDENVVNMDWSQPLEVFGGSTAL